MLLTLLSALLLAGTPPQQAKPPPQPRPQPQPPRPLPPPAPELQKPLPRPVFGNELGTLDAGTAPTDPSSSPLWCAGTEPFWSLELTPRSIVLTTPEVKPVTFRAARPFTPAGRTGTWIWQTWAQRKPAQIVVTQERCSDGMSDREFAFKILLIQGNSAMDGCCNYGTAPK